MAELQAIPAATAPPVVVVVNGLADLIPDSYSGDDKSVDIEEYFARYRQWFGINQNRFVNNAEQVAAIKYVLSGTALQWFNAIPAGNMPATVNNLQCDFFAKFRIAKTRLEWKKELEKCKYIPSTSMLPMMNKFQLYCDQWFNGPPDLSFCVGSVLCKTTVASPGGIALDNKHQRTCLSDALPGGTSNQF